MFVQLFPRNLIRFYFLPTPNPSTENSCLFPQVTDEIKIILIAPATLKSFKTTFFTMTDSKLNHLLLISNEELDEINIKLRTNNLSNPF